MEGGRKREGGREGGRERDRGVRERERKQEYPRQRREKMAEREKERRQKRKRIRDRMRESNVFSQHPTLDQNSLRDRTHLHREAMPALAKTLKDVALDRTLSTPQRASSHLRGTLQDLSPNTPASPSASTTPSEALEQPSG